MESNRSRVKEIVKLSEFEKQEIRDAYRSLIDVEWLNIKDVRLISIQGDSKKFKSFILISAGEVCGYKRLRSVENEWEKFKSFVCRRSAWVHMNRKER